MDTPTEPFSPMSRDLGLSGRGAHLVYPSIIGPIFAAVLVFNRVYWRISLVRTIGLDDVCILLSLVFLFAQCSVNLVGVDYGYGRPSRSLSSYNKSHALQMFWLDQIFYKFTINLTKLSILTLYLRIFSQPWFRKTCYTCIAIVTTYATASILATILQCTPVHKAWDKGPQGTCINLTAFWYANAIYNIITDIVILASVPVVVWTLRLSTRQRLGLIAVLGLGIFVFATSILRMTTLDVSSKSQDPTHGTLISTMWTTIESCTAVICACLPMARTPLQRLWPKLLPTNYGTGTGRSIAVATNTNTNTSVTSANASTIVGGGSSPKKGYESLQSPVGTNFHRSDLEMGPTRTMKGFVSAGDDSGPGVMDRARRTPSPGLGGRGGNASETTVGTKLVRENRVFGHQPPAKAWRTMGGG